MTLNGNWIYIFEQLGLAIVAFIALAFLLKGKQIFKLKKVVVLTIFLLTLVTHYNSFYRAIFDEWNNVISSLNSIHYSKQSPENTPYYYSRERYAWAPFTLFYEVVGFDKSYSNILMGGFGILMIFGAAISGAWLAGILSKSQIAALIAGLLIGISPNTFASLPWPSSIQGDSLGIILVSFAVAAWIFARQTKDYKGILLSLLFLAAALKGGGSVRTITVFSLLVMSDVILFWKNFEKRWIFDWVLVLLVEAFYLFATSSVHMSPRFEGVPLIVRAAQIMELTTKSFVPPTILVKIITYLIHLNSKITWVVVIGYAIFTTGWILAIWGFVKKKWKLFIWAWLWFYLTVFYAPWFAEGYGTTLASINDRLNFNLLDLAGYKYAYLPLVGIHIAVAIFLSNLMKIKKRLAIILIIILIGFRSYEFINLDYKWRLEIGTPNQEWQKTLFGLLPFDYVNTHRPNYLVLVDGKYNPIYSSSFSIEHGMYNGGSVIFFRNVEDFFSSIKKEKINPDNVVALGWDSGRQKMVNVTEIFKNWLKNEKSVNWINSNFGTDFYQPKSVSIGNETKFGDSQAVSPDLNVILPNPQDISLKLDVDVVDFSEYKGDGNASLDIRILCNTDHGKLKRNELINSQMTLNDQLNESKTIIPINNKRGKLILNTNLKCSGVILKKMIISGSPNIQFKINNIELSFPYPSGILGE